MSKNYELLHAANQGLELFHPMGGEVRRHGSNVRNGHDGTGRVCDEIARLVNRVFLNPGAQEKRVVSFSSVQHGDGCSWVCARVGKALAERGEGTVCLVDTNPGSSSLLDYFAVSGSTPNTAETRQAGLEDCGPAIRRSNLWVFSGPEKGSGKAVVQNPARLQARLSELRANFGYVLLDTPPVNESADAMLFGRLADGVILVLAAHETRRAAALRAKECLQAANIKLLGAVLNKRTYPIPNALYQRI